MCSTIGIARGDTGEAVPFERKASAIDASIYFPVAGRSRMSLTLKEV
jgi:hypothetical protein